MWGALFGNRGVIWKLGHMMYESSLTKKLVPPVVNFFKPEFVMTHGHKFYINKNDRVISLQLILNGKWEEAEIALFEQNVKPGDIVIDIGANMGYYTLVAARKTGPKGKVYAFEPDPDNFRLLQKNIAANGYINVMAINKAVGEKGGTVKLFLSNEDNTGDFRTYNANDDRKSLEVEMVTIDSVLRAEKKVDVIKIDIQGSEVKALKGAKEILKKSKQIIIFTEFWPRGLRQAGDSGKEYLKLLRGNGFEIWEIRDDGDLKKVKEKDILMSYPDDSLYNADLICIKK